MLVTSSRIYFFVFNPIFINRTQVSSINTSFIGSGEYPHINFFINKEWIADNASSRFYSPLFIDLLDCDPNNTKMYDRDWYFEGYLKDRVCGYTMKELEQALKKKGWLVQIDKVLPDIEDYLCDHYSNSSEANIDVYFDEYINNY